MVSPSVNWSILLFQLQETDLWHIYYTLMPRQRHAYEKKYNNLKRYGINEKTVLKWKHADTVEDRKPRPPKRSGSVLTELDEQVICLVRKQLRLPLDDLYIILKLHMPKLSHSNLYRCLQYHGLSRLSKEDDESLCFT